MAERKGDDLELRIISNIGKTATATQTVTQKLKEMGFQINAINTTLGKQPSYLVKATNGWQQYNITLDKSGKVTQELLKANYSNLSTNINKALTSVKTNARIGWSYIKNWTKDAIDFNETVNKFNVSMGTSVKQAHQFQNALSEAFGTSKNEMMDYQSTFKNIMSTTGELASDQAEEVSESLVKMALDYSSLYNVDQKSAMEKYESALTGSIRPIRNGAGYDVSKNSVIETAEGIGVERAYNDLTEMEKRLLRIITLMDQMKNTGAMQDLARTIEQPSNQLRIMKNQLQEIHVWLGNVFMGLLGRILPYINGFLMALKEVIKLFAIFVGYKDDGDTIDVFESAESSASGISSGLGSAAKSAKEIRKQLMGFDVLNVINTQKDTPSSGGGGGGGIGGVDPAILNALGKYDNLMNNVRMKAIDIRDKILDWLGVTDKSYKGLKLIRNILFAVLGIWGLFKLAQTIGRIKNLITMLKGGTPIASNFAAAFRGVGSGTDAMGEAAAKATTKTKLLNGALAAFDLALLSMEIGFVVDNWGNSFETWQERTAASLGKSKEDLSGFENFLVGIEAFFDSIGTGFNNLVRDLTGFDIIKYFTGIDTALQQPMNDFKEIERTNLKNLNKQLKEISSISYADYLNQLDKLVDSTGKVKEGYEGQAKVILEQLSQATGEQYELDGNQITRNGELIGSYDEFKKSIDKVIESKKAEIKLQAYEEMYKEAIISRQKAYENYVDRKEELDAAIASGDKKAIAEAQDSCNQAATAYWDLSKKVDEYGLKMQNATIDTTNTISAELVNNGAATAEQIQNILTNNYDNWKQTYDNLEGENKMRMLNMSTDVKTLGNENLLKAWKDLATNSKEQFTSEINLVAPNTRGALLNALAETQGMTPEIVQAYTDLGSDSAEDFKTAVSQLPENQKEALRKAMDNIEYNVTPEMLDLYYNMGLLSKDKYVQEAEKAKVSYGGDSITLEEGSIKEKGKKAGNWFTRAFNSVHAFFSGSSVEQRATGGPVDTGQLFLAREAGPELVGQIGNQTAVVNNDQIVQSVSQGVARAVSSVMQGQSNGGSFNVYLDGEQLRATIHRREERYANIVGA